MLIYFLCFTRKTVVWIFLFSLVANPCLLVANELVVFSCSPNNDLYISFSNMYQGNIVRYDTPAEAVANAGHGGAVFILAQQYPGGLTPVSEDIYSQAADKNLRMYIECPSVLPGYDVQALQRGELERGVVSSDFFEPGLQEMSIAAVNGLHYSAIAGISQSHLVAARVAGFDSAVYGLPTISHPLLFEYQDGILIATTMLSRFVQGRYVPKSTWQIIWDTILAYILDDDSLPLIDWQPVVAPAYTPDEELPTDHQLQAIIRGIEWYEKAKILIHADSYQEDGWIWPNLLPPETPVGDGSLGSREGIASIILQDGRQVFSGTMRMDCMSENAMAMAFAGQLFDEPEQLRVASNLLDFVYFSSEARKNERADPDNGNYGLIAWGLRPSWYIANYGDDNARVLLGTLATAALADENRWDEAVMKCLLANLRTTGIYGFRGERIDIAPLSQNGWQYYFKREIKHYSPHFESWLWALYLWAYHKTGDTLFYERARTGIALLMEQYPDGLRWTNGIAQEKARMILPLAWLLRVADTPDHRAWFEQAIEGLLELQDESGAIQEKLGALNMGRYPPPVSNAAYGTREASLIQENGDTVADMLYTSNFAFVGLREAFAVATALNMPLADRIRDGEDKLAEFLCRIQNVSEQVQSVDGGWFRAFDFTRWEAWGSNADHGWGAWSIESGWTQAWIISVLAMREMETSLWDLTAESAIAEHHPALRSQMIPYSGDPQLSVQETLRAGVVTTNQAATSISLPIQNGDVSNTITAVRLSGVQAHAFSVVQFPNVLEPNESGMILLEFDTGVVLGMYNVTVEIETSHSDVYVTKVEVMIEVGATPRPYTAYQRAVLRNEPILYWTFDEAENKAPAMCLVSSDEANALIPQGGAVRGLSAVTPGGVNLGYAAHLDGRDGSRFLAESLAFTEELEAYAIEYWLYAEVSQPMYISEAYTADGTHNSPSVVLNYFADELELFSGSQRSGVLLDRNQWSHVVMAFYGSDDGVEIYINGELGVAGTSDDFASRHAFGMFSLGATGYGTEVFQGKIDEYAIYDLGRWPDMEAKRDHVARILAHPHVDKNDFFITGISSYEHEVTLYWESQPELIYSIDAFDSVQNNWNTVATNIMASETKPVTQERLDIGDAKKMFFRVQKHFIE